MYLKKQKESTNPGLRSLLQKAARRGHSDIVEKTANYLNNIGDRTWLRSRSVVITFEECWPMAQFLSLNKSFESKLMPLLRVAAITKQKDAASLGALAFAFSEGDRSMLSAIPSDWALKAVSEALKRPTSFFEWAQAQCTSAIALQIVEVARKYLSVATWGWDKACIIAGAFFAATNNVPECKAAPETDDIFPYWVALDKHTPQGKDVLHRIAEKYGLHYRHLIWSGFYFESTKVNALAESPWWNSEKIWRLRRAGLTISEAEQIWIKFRPIVAEHLENDAEELRKLVENQSGIQTRLF